jgi:hypothetical protein
MPRIRMPQRCTALKSNQTPWKAWARPGTDPPRCAAYGAATRKVGAPTGNRNAQTHGVYASGPQGHPPAECSTLRAKRGRQSDADVRGPPDLDAVIADLSRRIDQLSDYIDRNIAELDAEAYAKLAALQGQLSSRLGRLLRDRQQLVGDADELTKAIEGALDEIREEWGIDV